MSRGNKRAEPGAGSTGRTTIPAPENVLLQPTDYELGERVAQHGSESARTYLLIHREDGPQVMQVPEGSDVTFGRSDEATVMIPDTRVSRVHARISRREGVLRIEDLGSRNGTRINGARVGEGEHRLRGGDLVEVGPMEVVVAEATRPSRSPAADVATGRLELELEKLREGDRHGVLLRIALDPTERSNAFETMSEALRDALFLDPRAVGEYVALIEAPDPEAGPRTVDRLRRIWPRAAVTSARFPEDGTRASELWERLVQRAAPGELPEGIVVADPAMSRVFQVARRLAYTDTTVLILGETGVGKEIVAEQIHRWSARSSGPFVRLNCASLPATLLESELFGHEKGAFTGADRAKIGYLEASQKGTLFLDEVGELPLDTQVKLLRVIENRCFVPVGGTKEVPVDVRFICATHRELQKEVEAGRFREDLYYRMNTFTLRVPALRERPAEISLLAELFARHFARTMGLPPPAIGPDAASAIARHRWPGNVRELKNAIEHAVVLAEGGVVRANDLPESVRAQAGSGAGPEPGAAPGKRGGELRGRLSGIEKSHIEEALEAEGGNQTRAAKRLGISRRTLIYKLEKYGLKK